ncbi:SMP-30/gluconolactonase/LRE family protein [Nitrospirota bacterium]
MKRTTVLTIMILLCTFILLSGCTAPEYTPPDYSGVFWPAAPALKRIQLKNVITSDLDIRPPSPSEQMFGNIMTFRFKKPMDVAIDTRGIMYVSDGYHHDVFALDPNNQTIRSFTVKGEFKNPYAIAVDNKNNLIAISDKTYVKIYTLSDRRAIITLGAKGKIFKNIAGIDFDPENKFFYVSDSKMHRVLRFSYDDWDNPKIITHFGSEKGGVYYPSHVAVSPEGLLYVVDTMHWRISIFDTEGNYVKSFGEHGDSPGMFGRPKGITISQEGFVFVSDGDFNVIQVFNKDGWPALVFGGLGGAPGRFTNPAGMAIVDNTIYIIDQTGRRLQVFDVYSDKYYQDISEKSLEELSKDPNEDEDEDENNIQ